MKRNRIYLLIFLYALYAWPQEPTNARPDSASQVPMDAASWWWSDSTFISGSAYGSFADIFHLIPGAHFFDRGSVGQPAYGFLFAGTPSSLTIDYDGLLLTDPISGNVDLNWIPVESIHRMELLPATDRCADGVVSFGQTLFIRSKDLSGVPVRSAVAYRTGGNSYDDVDARFGLQASRRLRINMGGVIKNYAGTVNVLEKYRAQKVHISLQGDLGRKWQSRYVLLRNRSDLNLPLWQPLPNYPSVNRLHQKEGRYDHGFFIEKDHRFSSSLQITDLHRELNHRGSSLLNHRQDVSQALWRTNYRKQIHKWTIQIGSDWRWAGYQSNSGGERHRSAMGGYSRFDYAFSPRLHANTTLALQKWQGGEWVILPSVHWHFQPNSYWSWRLWGERLLIPVGFAHLCGTGPFAIGQANLGDSCHDLVGLAASFNSSRIHIFASLSHASYKDGILAQIRAGETIPLFRNQHLQRQSAVDVAAEGRLSSWITVNLKAKAMYFIDHQLQNQPKGMASGYLQLNHHFFEHALDARLRFGFDFQSSLKASLPYYSDLSYETIDVGSALTPYLHAIFVIKDVTLFAAMQNPLNLNYTLVYPYPMPRGLFRWGFVWNFYD